MSRGHRLALLVVLAAAAALRLPRLGRVPDGLIPDEALSAYDAFSILRTGRDQYGEPLPLFPRSTARLGCLYMYATVPAVAALGLTETAARLAAALAGTATVLVLFALVREGYGPTVGLIAAGLIAISPWHVLLSRTGFDWVLLPALVTFSLWLLVRCARGAGSWIAAGVASGLALYSYAPGRALMPVLLLAFGLLHGRSLATRWRGAALAGALFVVLAAPVAASMAAGGGLERLESIRDQSEAAPAARSFLARYAAAFSPSFLLHPARGPELHRMSSAGLLYGFELPLIVLGAVHVLRHRCRLGRLLLLWLLLAPLTVAIHRDSPDPILSSTSLPAPQALAAIGAGWLIEALRPAGRWRNASSRRRRR